MPGVFEMKDAGLVKQSEILTVVGSATVEHLLRHPNVQHLLHNSTDLAFDLVLVEEFYQEALLMFGHQFGAPVVSVASFEFAQYFNEMFGVFGAWSHVPNEKSQFGQSMSFLERVENVRLALLDGYLRWTRFLPAQQALADKYFAHLSGKTYRSVVLDRLWDDSFGRVLQILFSGNTKILPIVLVVL